MSPPMEAHLRLLSILPVRTHLEKKGQEIDSRGWNGGRQFRTPAHVVELIKKYREEGLSYKEIKKELRVSTKTISKAIGACL
jgi:hypothetical protein